MKAHELSEHLGRHAYDVCRHYLSNGRRAGRYWQVGDVRNTKGRSLYVRLAGPGRVGKWNDAATGEHGDLLDVIQQSLGLSDLRAAMEEARRFLRLAPTLPSPLSTPSGGRPQYSNKGNTARRLYAGGRPLAGTVGEAYLNKRGITLTRDMGSLVFLRRAWFDEHTFHPALVAAVRDNAGAVTGINRHFLDGNARLIERRALGNLNGHAVRVGLINPDYLLVGEGLESTLSFTVTHPGLSLAATLSTSHMAAFVIPRSVRHLVIAADNGEGGRSAATTLRDRARAQGIAVTVIYPRLSDFNDDLVAGYAPPVLPVPPSYPPPPPK